MSFSPEDENSCRRASARHERTRFQRRDCGSSAAQRQRLPLLRQAAAATAASGHHLAGFRLFIFLATLAAEETEVPIHSIICTMCGLDQLCASGFCLHFLRSMSSPVWTPGVFHVGTLRNGTKFLGTCSSPYSSNQAGWSRNCGVLIASSTLR